MKKPVLFLVAILVFHEAVVAQDSLIEKSFVSFTAGPSFPVGAFASNDINKFNAGFANNGFTIEVKYSLQLDELFGFTSAISYGRYSLKNYEGNETTTASIKPWEYYEFLFGAMMTGALSGKTSMDVSVLSGTVFVNAYKVNINRQLLAKKEPTSAIPLKFAADFRYHFTNRFYVFAGANYTYMRANFHVTANSEEISFRQSLNTAGMNAGVGL